MANKNRNQSQQYDPDWDQRRYADYNDYSNTGYRNAGYQDEERPRTTNQWIREAGNMRQGDQEPWNKRDIYGSRNYSGQGYQEYDNPQYRDVHYRGGYRHEPGYDPYLTERRHEGHGNVQHSGYGDQRAQAFRDDNRIRHEDQYNRQDRRDDRDWWDRTSDEVASWFGDDDAERRRRMDKAVGPHKGKGPRGYSRSDDRIREDVCDRFSEDPYLDASDIEIKVNSRDVILEGTVDSKEAKRRAEDLAESISGVSNVENHLKVTHTVGSVGSTEIRDYERDRGDDRRRKSSWF